MTGICDRCGAQPRPHAPMVAVEVTLFSRPEHAPPGSPHLRSYVCLACAAAFEEWLEEWLANE